MHNKKNQNNMCDVTRDHQNPSLLQTATFPQNHSSPGAWSTMYFVHGGKIFTKRHSEALPA